MFGSHNGSLTPSMPKLGMAFLHVKTAQKSLHWLEIAYLWERGYCFSSSISTLHIICRKYFITSLDLEVAMVTT